MLFLVYALGNTLDSQCIALMPIATLLVSHAPDLRTIYGFPTHIHAYIGTTRAYLCVQSVNREEKKVYLFSLLQQLQRMHGLHCYGISAHIY